MTSLSGKTALVTGASRYRPRMCFGPRNSWRSGAGPLWPAPRARPTLWSINQERRRSRTRHRSRSCHRRGPQKLAFDVRRLVEDRLDVLVTDTGISKRALVEETTIQDFDSMFAVNVRASYLLQQLLPNLGAGSSVVFLSSAAAHAATAVSNLSVYAATKGVVETLVRHFAFILGQSRPMQAANSLSIQTLKRIAQPDDIADVVTFLASNDARWITGHTLRADGGTRL